jgi:hypothetical protein
VLGGRYNPKIKGTLSTMDFPRKWREVAPCNRKWEALRMKVWSGRGGAKLEQGKWGLRKVGRGPT